MTTRTNPNQLNPLDASRVPVGDGTFSLEVVGEKVVGFVPSPSGGGGGAGLDRRWNIGPGETSIDEFDDSNIGASYVRVDGTGALLANATWQEEADTLSVFNNGADSTAALHALVRPLSGAGGALAAGDGFITCLSLAAPSANYSQAGLILADGTTHGAGDQVVAQFLGQGGDSLIRCAGWTGYNTAGTLVGSLSSRSCTAVYLRLALISANTWRTDYSVNGHHWVKGTATASKTLTPTHVGIQSTSYNTSTKHIASYEFLRRVSGVT